MVVVLCGLMALAGSSPCITQSCMCLCRRRWVYGSVPALSCLMMSHIHFECALYVCVAE